MSDHEDDPIEEDDRGDTTYEVTISTTMSDGIVTEEEIRAAIYRGVDIIDSEDAIQVVRL